MNLTRRRAIAGGRSSPPRSRGSNTRRFTGRFDHRKRKLPSHEAAMRFGESIAPLPKQKEAESSAPIAEHLLASTIARACSVFGDEAARALPNVRCGVPQAGELVSL